MITCYFYFQDIPVCIRQSFMYLKQKDVYELTAYIYFGNLSECNYKWKRNHEPVTVTDHKYDAWTNDSIYAIETFGKTVEISSISICLIICEADDEDLKAECSIHVMSVNGNGSYVVKEQGKSMYLFFKFYLK